VRSISVFTEAPADIETYDVRVTGTATNPAGTLHNLHFDTIVTITKNCELDEFTLVESLDDQIYYIGYAETTFAGLFSQKFVNCPHTYSLSEAGWTGAGTFDDSYITAFETHSGFIKVFVALANEATFDLQEKTLTVTAIATGSLLSTATMTKSFTFKLTIKSECWDAAVTNPAFDTATYTGVNLWDDQSYTFSAMTANYTAETCGEITYVVTSVSLPSNDVYSINTLAVDGVAIDDQNWVGAWKFKVTGQLGAYDTYDSNEVTVTIVNPCTGTDITVTNFTPNLSTTILGADDTFSFPEATDSID